MKLKERKAFENKFKGLSNIERIIKDQNIYEYYYNGAGVAVADFNKNNLVDIYFVGNRKSNHLYPNKGDLKFQNITD